MGVSFIRPYILLFIPVIIVGLIISTRWLKRLNKAKRITAIILRSIVFALLILALCGTSLYWKLDTITTLFLIDGSDSTLSKRTEMESFIKEANKLKGPKDKVGVISFADDSQVESFISSNAETSKGGFSKSGFSKIEGKINGNYTNIENALTTALSLFTSNSNKRVVLITDGEENSGAASKIALSLQEQGVQLKYHKIEKTVLDDVAVDSVSVPQRLVLDEEFNVVAAINSTSSQGATLSLYSGRAKVGEQKVQLQKGTNKFVFRDKALVGGFKSYNIVVEPDRDSEVKNNEASTYTNVVAKPKVLILEDTKGEGDELTKMLKASSIDFTLMNALSAPRTVQEMQSYKAIITCNVSADGLNDGFLNALDSYVKDFGGGFIATGGENSFALGGYAKTPLEKVLPVYMDMRGKKEIPKMSMVLIIDHSGSMSEGLAGVSKVDMAKEAAIRSLDSLRVGKDEIGVMAFDGAYSWVVKRQMIKDVKAIEEDIGTIRAGGGTSILPALEEGYKSLKESDAKIKHIILLTDGQAEKDGYDALLKNFNNDNITVSTVAVGSDADKSLLQTIADTCGGRSYVTDEYTNIPKIFSKETFMAARMYLNNREFTPVINTDHVTLKGVAEAGLPKLLGYIGASPKETARVVLKSDEDDPILTVWQYGLGKTAAWNSDISGKWSANYVSWDKNLKLWQNIINFTIENYDSENASLEVSELGGKATLTFKDKKNDSELDTTVTVITPSGEKNEIKLNPSAPGEYNGTIDLKDNGVYMLSGKQTKNGDTLSAINAGYAMQYSPEYRINNSSNIDKLFSEIGGKIITSPSEVFTKDIEIKKGQMDLTQYLLALMLMLFMLDIAIRRLNINTYKLKLALKKIKSETVSLKESQKERINIRVVKKKKNIKKFTAYENIDKSLEVYDSLIKEEDNVKEKKSDLTKFENLASNNTLDTSQLLKNKKYKG